MKKLLLTIMLGSAFSFSIKAATIATNLPATNIVSLLTTNRASVYSLTLSSPKDTVVLFYDSDNIAAPFYGTNYTNGSFNYRVSTNITSATSFVGVNGYTNWYTNVGQVTYTLTNSGATSQLPIIGAMAVAAGTIQAKNVDWMFTRGISVLCNTNATIIIDYRTGQ